MSIFAEQYRETLSVSSVDKLYRGMEQLVARWAHNPKAVGSSPAPATTSLLNLRLISFFFDNIFIKHYVIQAKLFC